MAKTYVWGAVTAADKAHKYLTRYQATLTAGATTGQVAALIALIGCLADFLSAWHKAAPNP